MSLVPGFSTGGGGMSSKSGASMTDLSRSSVGQGGGVTVGNIDGDAAATLSAPWWMGGAGWRSTSPVAPASGGASMTTLALAGGGIILAGVAAWLIARR